MNINNKIEVLSKLTPQMEEVLRIQDEMSKDAFATEGLTYPEIRENYIKERKFWNEGGPQMEKSIDIAVPTPHGEVSVRLHYPNKNAITPCIFYIHGGGMVVGNNDTHDRIMRILAEAGDCIVAGIDYSLSPEAKYPQALEECAAVIQYLRNEADKYGIDKDNLGIAGDSGGANLSLGTFLYLRDHEKNTEYIKALLLYYGMFGLLKSGSMKLLGGPWDGLTEADLEFYTNMYLSKSEDKKSPYYNHYESDLTYRMPACYIVAAELDPLLDDSKTLYAVLKDKGFPCLYREYKGLIHAFLHYSKILSEAKETLQEGGQYFRTMIK